MQRTLRPSSEAYLQPYQIYKEVSNAGKNVQGSKKRARWTFQLGEGGDLEEVLLLHSLVSGKKKLFVNGALVLESQKVPKAGSWTHNWFMNNYAARIDIYGEAYEFSLDSKPFSSWPRVDPHLAASMAAAKRDSEAAFHEDERRRKEERAVASSGKTRSRRSSKEGHGEDKPPGKSGTEKQKNSCRRSTASGGAGGPRKRSTDPAAAAATVAPAEDILSANPAVFAIATDNGSFDPLDCGVSSVSASASKVDSAAVLQLGMSFSSVNVSYQDMIQQQCLPEPPAEGAPMPDQDEAKKDLWELAKHSSFVNFDDITDTRDKKSVQKQLRVTPDNRTLAELAASKQQHQKGTESQPAMMQPIDSVNGMSAPLQQQPQQQQQQYIQQQQLQYGQQLPMHPQQFMMQQQSTMSVDAAFHPEYRVNAVAQQHNQAWAYSPNQPYPGQR